MSEKDPILKVSSEAQRELFMRFSQQANGFPVEIVIGAAANILINGIRQTQHRRADAEARFDELFGKIKQLLMDHYESGVRLQGSFPFPQTVHANLFIENNKFPSSKKGH